MSEVTGLLMQYLKAYIAGSGNSDDGSSVLRTRLTDERPAPRPRLSAVCMFKHWTHDRWQ